MANFRKNIPTQKTNRPVTSKEKKVNLSTPAVPRMDNKTLLWLGVLLFVTFLCFSNALHNNFLEWDDTSYIHENKAIQKLDYPHVKEIFSSFYMANYHPLTSLTYAIEYSVVKTDSTFLYHIDNVLLHLLNVVLIFLLFRLVTRKSWIGLIMAALFALHPTRVESVAWISERKDVLYTFFFLLSLFMYQKFSVSGKKPSDKNYLLALVFFLFSLMSKSAAVTLPVVLVLLDYLNKRKFTAATIIEKLPFFILSVVFGVLALKSQTEAIKDLPDYSLLNRILMLNFTVLKYIYLSVIPIGLSGLHPYPSVDHGVLPLQYLIAPFAMLAILAAVIFSIRKTRIILFGMLFFLVTISLVLQLIPVGGAIMAERYTYVPYLGIYFIIAWYAVKYVEDKGKTSSALKPFISGLLCLLLVIYGFTTYSRNRVWKEDLTLWDDVIATYPNTAFTAYLDRGKAKQDKKDIRGAYDDYSKSLILKPDYYKALINRGLIKYDSGNVQGAMIDYNKGIAAKPDYHIGYLNRAVAKMKLNDNDGAMIDLNKALEIQPNLIEAIFNRGTVKFRKLDIQGAVADYCRVLEINPGYIRTYNKLGIVYYNQGDKETACREWKTGMDLGDETCKANWEQICK